MIAPEQDLWREVLHQAVCDALYGASGSAASVDARIMNTRAARAYITTPSRDLSLVCDLADLDMTAVCEAMTKRLADAPTPEALFAKGTCRTTREVTITYDGQTLTHKQWAAKTGLSVTIIRSRFANGWTSEQILTTPHRKVLHAEINRIKAETPRPKGRTDPIYLTHDYQTLTVKAWSKRTGIQTATIHFRLRSGWSVARSLTTATRPQSDRGGGLRLWAWSGNRRGDSRTRLL
tara:strand:- start:135003 stop:135707 length:705 start_codon:yes stop_codon:yes gene_type:complete